MSKHKADCDPSTTKGSRTKGKIPRKEWGNERVDWSNFVGRQSDSGRLRNLSAGDSAANKIMYHHYLPAESADTTTFTETDLQENYEEFDTICHVTSLENAEQIIRTGRFNTRVVCDNSVVTGCTNSVGPDTGDQQPLHPVSRSQVLWYGPWKKSNIGDPNVTVKRYGNVVFSMTSLSGYEGIERRDGDFNYYFIEVIEYQKELAARILVTVKTYPGLRKYDPSVFGGPWYKSIDGKHYQRKKYLDGRKAFTLEIMREVSQNENLIKWWMDNHEVSFSYCWQPRKGVKVIEIPDLREHDYIKQTLRLLFCLKGSNDTFTLTEHVDGTKLQQALQSLHREAMLEIEGFDRAVSLANFSKDTICGFKEKFMNGRSNVVEVYTMYILHMTHAYRKKTMDDMVNIVWEELVSLVKKIKS